MDKVWRKILGENEEVKYEFTIGNRYRKFWMIISILLSFIFIGIPMLFYYGFYLKVANKYAFTNKRVLIHKGWLSTNLTSIDYNKITDVKLSEPILEKIFYNAGHLSINTAGSSNHEIVLRHVEEPYELKKKLDNYKD